MRSYVSTEHNDGVNDDLVWADGLPEAPHRPVMVVAFSGMFDAAGVSTAALAHLTAARTVHTVATIDPDGFYDFSEHRPTIAADADGQRRLHWPVNDFDLLHSAGAPRDLVVLRGVEPDIRWRSFAAAIMAVANTTRCETIVTVGAFPEPLPHTRTPQVFGSTTTAGLASRLGLSMPRYQGPTGVVGVLHDLADSLRVPAIALRVGVPHYLTNAEHPKSVAALLRHLEHVLGFPTGHGSLDAEIAHWQELHDAAVAADPQAAAFVRMLEIEFDRHTAESIPSADDLGAAFEAFLREQDPDEDG